MLETAIAQLRFAASMVTGVRFSPWSFDRLIDAMLETRREFGEVGIQGAEFVSGPTLDEQTRRQVQLRRFRKQAVRAMRDTDYYRRLFQRLDVDSAKLDYEDIERIPVTTKDALRTDPDAFVRRKSRPFLRSLTTGTTGRPTSICFSEYELRTAVALSAMAFSLSGEIGPEDVVQISTSSRAVLGNLGLAGACARIGALTYMAGVIEPAQALTMLTEERHIEGKKPKASVLSTYSSYLGELIEAGLRLGYGPSDFGLERIFVGGEVVTQALKVRALELFGPLDVRQSYATTETIPGGGTSCSQGHLHFEPSHGLLEVLDPETGEAAAPGEAGTIVATPFPPFRETTILLRYDTQDVVRPVAGPLTCSLRNLPASTDILGKLGLSVQHEDGWTFPRDVLEALECVDDVPLPARCGFWAVPGGVAVEVVVRDDTASTRRSIEASLEAWGVPVGELRLVGDRRELQHALPLRCDLREVSFGADQQNAVVGV